MGLFPDNGNEASDRAIANVKSLGARASKEDRALTEQHAKGMGDRATKAREALGKK